jgi:hypothetical protein
MRAIRVRSLTVLAIIAGLVQPHAYATRDRTDHALADDLPAKQPNGDAPTS